MAANKLLGVSSVLPSGVWEALEIWLPGFFSYGRDSKMIEVLSTMDFVKFS